MDKSDPPYGFPYIKCDHCKKKYVLKNVVVHEFEGIGTIQISSGSCPRCDYFSVHYSGNDMDLARQFIEALEKEAGTPPEYINGCRTH